MEKDLRLVYDDRQSTFEELLNKVKSVTIRRKNVLVLVTALYKVHCGRDPDIMNKILKIRNVK